MKVNIKEWVNCCLDCQKVKVTQHTKSKIEHPSFPTSNRFEVVHMDIVGPLRPAKSPGCSINYEARYLVTFIDKATRWLEATPISDICAETIAQAFLQTWVSRFGIPLYLVTDRGRQFESELFTNISKMLGVHRLRTTAYNPKCNAMIERVHEPLKLLFELKMNLG